MVKKASKTLYVTAKFHVKKDEIDDTKKLVQNLITNTLQNEKGCLSYTSLQSNDTENEFTAFEVW